MKKILSLVLALVLSLGIIGTIPTTASAATAGTSIKEVSKITLQNVKTSQYLNYDYGKLANGTSVRVWPFDSSKEQLWSIVEVAPGTYRIVAYSNTKFALDIYAPNRTLKNGLKADIWKAGGSESFAQNLIFTKHSDGTFSIRMAKNTGLALAATSSKGRVMLAKYNANDKTQRWSIRNSSGKTINVTKEPTATVPTPSNSTTNWDSLVGKTVGKIKDGDNYTKWYGKKENVSAKGGYTGQCTWYVIGRFYEVNGINIPTAPHAKSFLKANANNKAVVILKGADKIQAGAICVDTAGDFGHVSFIEHVVYKDGKPVTVYFTECNWDGNGVYNAGKDCVLQKMSYSKFVSSRSPDGYIVAK